MKKINFHTWQTKLAASPHYKWLVLTVVQFGIILVGIGATSVNMAIPTLSRVFNVPITYSQWVIVIYATTMAISLPIGGKLPQYFGRKNVVMGGFLLFSISSILCATTNSIHMLFLFQIFLGLGSSALLANSNVITYLVFPKKQHGMAMGVNGTVASIGYGLGMLLGGYLVHQFGWSSIFWLNLPFGVIATLLSAIILVEEKIIETTSKQVSFDYIGAILFAIFVASLMLCLNNKLSVDERTIALTSCLLGLGLFIMQERRAKTPLLALSLFKIPTFTIGAFLRLTITIIYSSGLFFIPIYTQEYMHLNALQSGIIMLPLSIALFFFGPIGGILSDRLGSRWVTASGFIACALSLAILSKLHGTAGIHAYLGMFLLGSGMGLFVPPNNSTTLSAIPAMHIGFVSGFLWSMAYIGTAVGTAFSSLMLSMARNNMPGNNEAIIISQSNTFHVLIPCAIVGVLLCLMRHSKQS